MRNAARGPRRAVKQPPLHATVPRVQQVVLLEGGAFCRAVSGRLVAYLCDAGWEGVCQL